MKQFVYTICLLALVMSCSAPEKQETFDYPETAKVDTVDTYFGTEVSDPYRWLEDDNSDETAKWVTAQNKVTRGYLDNISYKDNIKKRLKELFDYERVSAPNQEGDY